MNQTKVAILVSGRGSNMESLILKSNQPDCSFKVVIVISNNKQAIALSKAKSYGIKTKVICDSEFNSKISFEKEIIQNLKKEGVTVVALAGFMKIIGKTLLEEYPYKILNIHPSLLPSFKGLHAQKKALNYGVKYSGCTVHIVDKGVDSGSILGQKIVEVSDNDDEKSLSSKILKKEHELFPHVLDLFCRFGYEIQNRKVINKFSGLEKETLKLYNEIHFGKSDLSEILKQKKSKKPIFGVSACLLGIPCRYDGKSKINKKTIELLSEYTVLPICPEVLSGFPVPRVPMEFKEGDGSFIIEGRGKLVNERGKDLGKEMKKGVESAFEIINTIQCVGVILKENSPSCGINFVYQNGSLIRGMGVFASLLSKNSINILSDVNLTNFKSKFRI
jgi:phosphoribosylglycinamide formyltransferase 1